MIMNETNDKIENLTDFLKENLEFYIPSRELGEKIAAELDDQISKDHYKDFMERNYEEFQKQNPGVTLTLEDFQVPSGLKTSPDLLRQYIAEQACYRLARMCVKENLVNQKIGISDFIKNLLFALMNFNLSEEVISASVAEFSEWAESKKELIFDWGVFRSLGEGQFELVSKSV